MSNPPERPLTIAVLATHERAWPRTAASVRDAAACARTDVDVVLVSTERPPPSAVAPPGPVHLRVEPVFRLGRGYAKNRVLDIAETPVVVFVEAGQHVPGAWIDAVSRVFAAAPDVAMIFAARAGWHDAGDGGGGAALRGLLASLQGCGTPVVAVRREAALAVGGFPVDPGADAAGGSWDDLDLAVRLLRSGRLVRSLDAAPDVRDDGPAREGERHRSAAREIGRIARRQRSLRLCTLYLASLRRTSASVALGHMRRFAAGLVAAPSHLSPIAALDAMPSAVREVLGGAPIVPAPASRPPKTHLMYAAGRELLVHVYVNPSPRLRRSLRERESIRARVAVAGIPALRLAADDVDALWVVEDRLRGEHPSPSDVAGWFDRVAAWAVQFAGAPGPPLRTTDAWAAHCAAVLEHCPEVVRAGMADALERVGRLPSAHMHGDLQRRNILLTPSGVGVVDWEGAWLHGIPGLDLVFLALLAHRDRPDPTIIDRLLRDRDPPFGALKSPLARLGLPGDTLRPALLAMLGTWALGEDRRLQRTRAAVARRPYRDLLLSFTARLAS